jgi:hypothetical protein
MYEINPPPSCPQILKKLNDSFKKHSPFTQKVHGCERPNSDFKQILLMVLFLERTAP